MKVDELRLLIKEVVRETMREELNSILTEAVQIASTPSATVIPSQQPKPHFPTPDWVKDLQVAETQQPVSTQHVSTPNPVMRKNPMDLLRETARGMTSQDLSNFS